MATQWPVCKQVAVGFCCNMGGRKCSEQVGTKKSSTKRFVFVGYRRCCYLLLFVVIFLVFAVFPTDLRYFATDLR